MIQKILKYKFLILFFIKLFFYSILLAQNCTNATINNSILKICGNNCTNFNFKLPNLKSTSDYKVRAKQYTPYNYITSYGLVDNILYNNNSYSSPKPLSFPFCFYDSIYTKIVLSANGGATFDTTNSVALCASVADNALPIPTNFGSQCTGSSYVPKASILAVFCDLDPRNGYQQPSAPDRKIEYRVEGIAPCRRFIASYYKIGSWGTWGDVGCWPNGQATFQTVLYESTGIIEVNIETYTCPAIYSSAGRAILGIQNWNRDKAVAAPGKNATNWSAIQESYQFIPSGGNSRFISCGLYNLNGSFIQNADTSSTTDGMLNINFANICPVADTTKYIVRTSFTACPSNAVLTYEDTIKLIKNNNNIVASLNIVNNCTNNPSIVVTATGDNFMYSLNGGVPQTNNTFTNVPTGTNQVVVNGITSGCSIILNANVGNSNISLQSIADTSICIGNAITLNTISTATNFSWQPTTGLSNANIASPLATPNTTTQYIVTAGTGTCTKKDTVTITILPKPIVMAGTNISVLVGDNAQLNGSVQNANSYVWSPATYLTNPNIINPIVQSPNNTTLYKLIATAGNGCKNLDSVLVTVIPNCVNPKNAFTPNGDGINDLWQVYSSYNCLKNVSVKVYNRYGNLVYKNENYTNNWNGTYNNKPIPDGTYYYSITYTLITGRTYTSKGDVTILR